MNNLFVLLAGYFLFFIVFSLAEPASTQAKVMNQKKATFAGGCFWCMEKPFEQVEGVLSVTSGYSMHQKQPPAKVAFCWLSDAAWVLLGAA